MTTDLLETFVVVMGAVFFVVDPFAAVPLFIAMTRGDSSDKQRRMARRASIATAIVLVAFAFVGRFIFEVFGITLPAFRVAGGVILFLLAIDMVRAQTSRTKTSPEETREAAQKDDIAVIPLAIPMLSGPGAIATVMVLTVQAKDWRHHGLVVVAILLTAIASYFILRAAPLAERVLKQTGLNILTRIMGLLLCAIAIQFITGGLRELLPGLASAGVAAAPIAL